MNRNYGEFTNSFIKHYTPATEQRGIMNKLDRLKPKVEHTSYVAALEEYNIKFIDLSLQLDDTAPASEINRSHVKDLTQALNAMMTVQCGNDPNYFRYKQLMYNQCYPLNHQMILVGHM